MVLRNFTLIAIVCLLASCSTGRSDSTNNAADQETTVVIWGTDVSLGAWERILEPELQGIDIDFFQFDDIREYHNHLNLVLSSGSTTPDLFTASHLFNEDTINRGLWEPLTKFGVEKAVEDNFRYLVSRSRDKNGEITSIAYNAAPGGVFYRREMAKNVLGTDSPEDVSQWTSSMEKFYELGTKFKNVYGEEKHFLSCSEDLWTFLSQKRDHPYVNAGRFAISDGMQTFFRYLSIFNDEALVAEDAMWSEEWFKGLADGSTMCFILPTWGLQYVLKPNAEMEAYNGNVPWRGDWGVAVPPEPFWWGGSWIGMNRFSTNKEESWLVLEQIATNVRFQKKHALFDPDKPDTAEFVSNSIAVKELSENFSDPFLNGQNSYEFFNIQAKAIDGDNFCMYDTQIERIFMLILESYAYNPDYSEQIIDEFYLTIEERYPFLEIVR